MDNLPAAARAWADWTDNKPGAMPPPGELVDVLRACAEGLEAREWRLFDSAPERAEVIPVWRKDAGIFFAHFVSPSEMQCGDDEEPAWYTVYGDDLTGDLPTLWFCVPPPPHVAGAPEGKDA